MKKPFLIFAATATLGLIAYSQTASASADGCYGTYWSFERFGWNSCEDMTAISPASDTRTNLLLMMLDRDGKSVPLPPGGTEHNYEREILPFTQWENIGRAYAYSGPANLSDEERDRRWRASGTICQSNIQAADDFVTAVRANKKIGEGDRSALITARHNYEPACSRYSWSKVSEEQTAKATLPDFSGISSAQGKEFSNYLVAANQFYTGNFSEATASFTTLSKADDKWVRETATYMIARSELNRAQATGNDKYGDIDTKNIDKNAVASADAALQSYLKAYPKGRYADSASGLKRRVWWLGGDKQKLADTYQAAFRDQRKAGDFDSQLALVEEIDLKMPRENISDPHLLAMLDLQRMRPDGSRWGNDDLLSRSELEGQSTKFASEKSLFNFLRANHAYYVGNNPKEVLSLIPDAAKQKSFNNLEFSRQLLRGHALESTKDVNARGFWLDMINGTEANYQRPLIELAIALHDERTRKIERVFAPNSVVTNTDIRRILLTNIAGPELLRQQATDKNAPQLERENALATLLEKSLDRGRYKEFLGDLPLISPVLATTKKQTSEYGNESLARSFDIYKETPSSDGYSCPTIKITVTALAANSNAIKPRLCLGDFFRTSGRGYYDYTSPESGMLGSSPTMFPGKRLERLDFYTDIMADTKASADDRAYSLYRAVNCFAPSGSNDCGTGDVPQSQRKSWFQQLKRDYPNSKWAKELKYYW